MFRKQKNSLLAQGVVYKVALPIYRNSKTATEKRSTQC